MTSSPDETTERPVRTPLLIMAVLTIALVVVAAHHGVVMSVIFILAFPVELAVYLVAVLCYLPLMFILVAGRKLIAAVTGLVLMVVGMASLPVAWADPAVRARVRYAIELPAFAYVAEMARQGRLTPEPPDEYYGPELPWPMRYLSANSRVATIGESGGEPVLFIPDWMGVPDDAVGFAHFAGPATGRYDGFGLQICPTAELGGGWWWMDACPRRR